MDYANAKLRHKKKKKRINSPKLNVKNKDTPSSSTLNNKSLLITTQNENKENNKKIMTFGLMKKDFSILFSSQQKLKGRLKFL